MNEFVKLSAVITCPKCGKYVQMWGELVFTGGWHCPKCEEFFSYIDLRLPIAAPYFRFSKYQDNLARQDSLALEDNEIPKARGMGSLMGAGPLGSGPLGTLLTTEYLPVSPNFAYRIKQQRPRLMSKALDRTRATRTRGDDYFIFELVFKGRAFEEYEDLLNFHRTMDFDGLFIFTDPVISVISPTLRSDFACYFDSDIDAEPPSFNDIDFNVNLEESNVSPKPPSPPPTDLSGTVLFTPLRVSLSWEMLGEPFDGFKVMRDSGSGFVQIADQEETTLIDSDVVSGHTYSYKVFAYNANFNSRETNTITKNT